MGITAIGVMPVGQFPGERNWGYGVLTPLLSGLLGGPQRLKGLVNACHEQGLAVILDVVYNHLGPVGSYLSEFGPRTKKYSTPWGALSTSMTPVVTR